MCLCKRMSCCLQGVFRVIDYRMRIKTSSISQSETLEYFMPLVCIVHVWFENCLKLDPPTSKAGLLSHQISAWQLPLKITPRNPLRHKYISCNKCNAFNTYTIRGKPFKPSLLRINTCTKFYSMYAIMKSLCLRHIAIGRIDKLGRKSILAW